jgi:TetR/AcrR family transcriptional regulator
MGSSQLDTLGKPPQDLSRKERQNLRQRGEILQAALRLFSEKGYHNVSMHEIAREAEFGIGTLYKYFINKEDLYKALIMRVAEEHHAAIMKVLEQETNPLQAVTGFVTVRLKLFCDNLPFMRLYFAETRGAGFNIKAGLDRDVLKLVDKGMKKLACIFEQGIRDHVFRNLGPYQMALALEGIVNAFLVEFMNNPDRVREEDILSTSVDIFLNGVRGS